jgi:membrane associated rhomboid family serine protease
MGLYNRDYMRRDEHWRGIQWRVSVLGWMMLLCIGVFVVQMMLPATIGGQIATPGAVTMPALLDLEAWRLFTYPFLHGNAFHLIVNLIGLWFVGRIVIEDLGNRHFLGVFFSGAVAGAMLNVAVYPTQPLVGASAGLWALLVALTVRMPELPIGFPFLPGVTLRLKNLTIGILVFEVISAIAQFVTRNQESALVLQRNDIASLAHLGGALAGWIYVLILCGSLSAMVRQSEEHERWWREQRKRRREPTRVIAGRRAAVPEPRETAEVDFIKERVDPILEKLHEHGPGSLSAEERRILDDAAKRLNRG